MTNNRSNQIGGTGMATPSTTLPRDSAVSGGTISHPLRSDTGSRTASVRSGAMRRWWSVIASVAAGLFLSALALPASAQPTRIPQTPIMDQTLQGVCPFDVFLHFLRQKETATIFSNKQGEKVLAINGPLAVQLTNTTTGKSIDLNIPGPARIDLQTEPPEATLTGPWLLVFNAPVVPSDLELLIGRWIFSVQINDLSTGSFTVTMLSGGSGTMQDVCLLLS
jgi:hypothetical protein